MEDRLSWNEIAARYPNEWVVLVDYELDQEEEIVGGKVLAHSREKSELQSALESPDDAAVLYTGPARAVAGVMVRIDDEV